MIWRLCLLYLAGGLGAVRAGPVKWSGKTADRVARREDVNVLMYGVIQLGESINNVYKSTEGKVANILLTLNEHERALEQLREQTAQAGEVEIQIKRVIELLVAGRNVAKLHMSSPTLIRSNPLFFFSFHVPWPLRSDMRERTHHVMTGAVPESESGSERSRLPTLLTMLIR
uniref:Uncharacterized protein n=1 Tax=Hippocampus comes TaxID=109280 RepID=A0A3Q2ZGV9_HIPCM